MPVCIECAQEVDSLFCTYGKDNIVLTRCKNCREIADKYVEFDGIVQAIDLILHKLPLYRHLLLNRPFKLTRWHKAVVLLAHGMIEVFRRLHFSGWASASNRVILSLLVRSICGALINYLSIWMILMLLQPGKTSNESIQKALILGTFPRLFQVLFLVWEYGKEGSLDSLVTMATLTSQFMALKAISFSNVSVLLSLFLSSLIRLILDA